MKLQDLASYRADFPMLLKKGVYLDNAATTFKPSCVIDAIMEYYTTNTSTVHRGVYQLSEVTTRCYHDARLTLKEFIHAKSEKEIIFTSGTTASLNLLAFSFGEAFIREGDEILISEIEHHSNLVPWQMLCERKNAVLKQIPVNEKAELDLEALEQLLSDKTKLVSLPHISNAFGVENPVKEIVSLVRRKSSAKICIDGAQSAPHLKVDVQDLDVDFYAFSAHKMYGPTGIGILYGKEALLNQMPPYQGGGDMIEKVSFTKTTYNDLPFKFEAGTPNIAGVLGFKSAVDYLNQIGIEIISDYEQELLEYAMTQLKQIQEVEIYSKADRKGALISFGVQGVHPLDLATLLDLKGIALRSGHLCAQPGLDRFNLTSMLRISFAFYNTQEEIDFFIQSLKEVIKSFK